MQVAHRDEAALDRDDGAVAVVVGLPDRAADRRGGEAALRAESAVPAAEQRAHRALGLRGVRAERPDERALALRTRAAVAAVERDPGDRGACMRLRDDELRAAELRALLGAGRVDRRRER